MKRETERLPERTIRTDPGDITFAKLVFVFTVGCVLGFVLESAYCLVTKGYVESRRGMVVGPFNQVYGFGCVLMVLFLTPFARRGNWKLFTAGAVMGGVFEYAASWAQEKVLGTVSWEYSGEPFSIGGRTTLVFMAYWGLLGLVFMRLVYPRFSRLLDRIPQKPGIVVACTLAVTLGVNMVVSLAAVSRWRERLEGAQPDNAVEAYLDTQYPDERLEAIYPNMRNSMDKS